MGSNALLYTMAVISSSSRELEVSMLRCGFMTYACWFRCNIRLSTLKLSGLRPLTPGSPQVSYPEILDTRSIENLHLFGNELHSDAMLFSKSKYFCFLFTNQIPFYCIQIYKICPTRNLIYIHGSIPGHKGNYVNLVDGTFTRTPECDFRHYILS